MMTGRVIGSIYSTIQHPCFNGKRLMVVEKTDERGQAGDDYLIAVDTVGSGPGDQVLVVDEGNGARQILEDPTAPVRSVIVGIIDRINVA